MDYITWTATEHLNEVQRSDRKYHPTSLRDICASVQDHVMPQIELHIRRQSTTWHNEHPPSRMSPHFTNSRIMSKFYHCGTLIQFSLLNQKRTAKCDYLCNGKRQLRKKITNSTLNYKIHLISVKDDILMTYPLKRSFYQYEIMKISIQDWICYKRK